jgi:predicted flavoprotein YhiN
MKLKKIIGIFVVTLLIGTSLLDGDTGGYNLQEAFLTGYLAGESAAK